MEQKSKKIKVRGTGTYDPETQKFGFEPFNEAPSTQQNVKTCAGGGKRWVTMLRPVEDNHAEEQNVVARPVRRIVEAV